MQKLLFNTYDRSISPSHSHQQGPKYSQARMIGSDREVVTYTSIVWIFHLEPLEERSDAPNPQASGFLCTYVGL